MCPWSVRRKRSLASSCSSMSLSSSLSFVFHVNPDLFVFCWWMDLRTNVRRAHKLAHFGQQISWSLCSQFDSTYSVIPGVLSMFLLLSRLDCRFLRISVCLYSNRLMFSVSSFICSDILFCQYTSFKIVIEPTDCYTNSDIYFHILSWVSQMLSAQFSRQWLCTHTHTHTYAQTSFGCCHPEPYSSTRDVALSSL